MTERNASATAKARASKEADPYGMTTKKQMQQQVQQRDL
jgi:hypothetical protein